MELFNRKMSFQEGSELIYKLPCSLETFDLSQCHITLIENSIRFLLLLLKIQTQIENLPQEKTVILPAQAFS